MSSRFDCFGSLTLMKVRRGFCGFEMQIPKNFWLIKWLHVLRSMEVFGLPACHFADDVCTSAGLNSRLEAKVLTSGAVVVFPRMLLRSTDAWVKAWKRHVWHISFLWFLVSHAFFFAAARVVFFMAGFAGLHILADGWEVLVLICDLLDYWIVHLGPFPIFCRVGFDPLSTYIAFWRG